MKTKTVELTSDEIELIIKGLKLASVHDFGLQKLNKADKLILKLNLLNDDKHIGDDRPIGRDGVLLDSDKSENSIICTECGSKTNHAYCEQFSNGGFVIYIGEKLCLKCAQKRDGFNTAKGKLINAEQALK